MNSIKETTKQAIPERTPTGVPPVLDAVAGGLSVLLLLL